MKILFIDTSGFYAIADTSDHTHAQAVRFFDLVITEYKFVTTNYVLDELYTLILAHHSYQLAVSYKKQIDNLIDSRVLKIVWIDEAIANQSWQIFEKFNIDKEWSFTDCTSYAVMKQLDITEVFTLDHHFAQMGFMKQP